MLVVDKNGLREATPSEEAAILARQVTQESIIRAEVLKMKAEGKI